MVRQKRIKAYRKVMQLYSSSFKFREPYQLLVDAAFCQSVVQQKLDFQARLEDVLQGAVKPMITQCCMQALYDLGPAGQATVDMAKEFERRKCTHFKTRPEYDCMTAMAGTDNKNRYVIATQSLPLRKVLRGVPGLPLIYINRSVVLLETPSDKTMAKKKEMENVKLHAPASELAFLSKTSVPSTNSTNLIDSAHTTPLASTSTVPEEAATVVVEVVKKKKVKGPKGPNPLSVKKKKPDPTTPSAAGKGKKRGRGEEGEVVEERKKMRVDEDKGRLESLSTRGGEGRGEVKKKRKRSKKVKTGTEEGKGDKVVGDES